MTFPVVFHIFGRPLAAHEVCELAAYVVGVQIYVILHRRDERAAGTTGRSAWLIVWCALGAMIGAKVLAWLEMSPDDISQVTRWSDLIGGKTIVGGLLGGWIAVELAKKYFQITERTGDGYVPSLVLGIAIGRVGCFLEGLPDHTYGIATRLPWGVDFGDGVHRHPTQLYEIAFALFWGAVVWIRARWPHARGNLFRLFMLGYFTFRLFVEFIKPTYRPDGLSAIQWACVVGIGLSAYGLMVKPARLAAPEVQHVAP
jgi:phosphatidylglycerol---prolipoprotein diacylglyceryl transferase